MKKQTTNITPQPDWVGIIPFHAKRRTGNNDNSSSTEEETSQHETGSGEEGGVSMPGKKDPKKNISRDE